MTEPTPSWLRRGKPTLGSAPPTETFVRDTISTLRSKADQDVTEILASALNTYTAAIIRLRGNDIYYASDLTAILAMWEILLDTARKATPDYASGKVEMKPEDLDAKP